MNMAIRRYVNNLLATPCLPLVTSKTCIGVCLWSASHLVPLRMTPRTSYRNEQLVNMAIGRTVDDLLGATFLPDIGSNSEHSISPFRTLRVMALQSIIGDSPDDS